MSLGWLRDEKNQRLLAWITAAAGAGWALFVYFNPPGPPAGPAAPVETSTLPPNAAGQSKSTQNIEIGSVRGDAELDAKQKKTNPKATDSSTSGQTGDTPQNTTIGVIDDRAKVTIEQQQ